MAKTAPTPKIVAFLWEGLDRRGAKNSGEISAESMAAARLTLKKQGINATKIKKKPQPLFGNRGKPITPGDVAVFTRQMATMIKAGVPLVQSFEIVADGLDNPSMRTLVLSIKEEVASGTAFATALSGHPKYFDELFISLIGAGEQSGALETMLDRVATYKEKTEALKSKIKKAMTYPIAVTVIAFVVTAILLVFVVPAFATTFAEFGSELPAFTQMVVELSEFMQKWWLVIGGTVIGIVMLYKYLLATNRQFKERNEELALKLPIIGPITKMSVVARFSRTLSTTFAAGVPLVDALESVMGAAGNIVYARAIRKIRDDVMSGQQLNFSIRSTGLFPLMLMQMVAIGEEAGSLDAMLDKVANYFEEEVDGMVDSLTSLMEPIIMGVLGILIGGLLIAMYLPIFSLGNAIG